MRSSAWEDDMQTARFYQATADAMGLVLYLYPDGSVSNYRKADAEPTAKIEPHASWRQPADHGVGEQLRQPAQYDWGAPPGAVTRSAGVAA
jgi:hypothetical protein